MSCTLKFIFERTTFLKCCQSKCQKRTLVISRVLCRELRTIIDIKTDLLKLLQVDSFTCSTPKKKDHFLQYLPTSQAELPVRRMKDSYSCANIPIASNAELREKYVTFWGSVRLGRLLEDVDLFAGHIAYKHIMNPKYSLSEGTPYMIVTAYIDQIVVTNQPKTEYDIKISGHVSWVGESSMEVVVFLHQEIDGKSTQITKALVVMAARNRENTAPALVNKVLAETPEEQIQLDRGTERKLKRTKLKKESFFTTSPAEDEFKLIHDLFMETNVSNETFLENKKLPNHSKWMRDSKLETLINCHPEHRNAHNKVFGGFILRQALELSWAIGFLHRLKIPMLVNISNIGFYVPVEVGSLLKLSGSVVYSEKEYIVVFVHAYAFGVNNITGKSTNDFHFTYKLEPPVDKIYPTTYLEAMRYIEGRRRFLNTLLQ